MHCAGEWMYGKISTTTVDQEIFTLKIFVVRLILKIFLLKMLFICVLNFCGWSQPWNYLTVEFSRSMVYLKLHTGFIQQVYKHCDKICIRIGLLEDLPHMQPKKCESIHCRLDEWFNSTWYYDWWPISTTLQANVKKQLN